MAFWTGLLEGLTGHQQGAFKGFKMKDILDEDMWKKAQRIRQQPGWSEASGRYEKVGEPLFDERTGQPMMTRWYKGKGRPEFMSPGVGGADTSRSSRSQPSSTALMKQNQMAVAMEQARQAQTQALPSNVVPPPQPLSGNPYKRDWVPGMSEIGGNKVPTMYKPYMFGLRQDQMGAEQFNPLNRRIQQSKRDQRGLPTSVQYSTGIRDAVGTLGDAFLPADKVTKRVVSADPTKFDTETTTITEKILGPSGHRTGAFKDTAADVWKNIREDDIIKYWMNQFRGN